MTSKRKSLKIRHIYSPCLWRACPPSLWRIYAPYVWCIAWIALLSLACMGQPAGAGQKQAKSGILPACAGHADRAGTTPNTKARYMVQVGTYPTLQGLKDGYYTIPERIRPKVLVCRSGSYYTLRCGAFTDKEKVDDLFKQFKEMGLEPIVVKADPATCKPAGAFLASRATGASTPTNASKASLARSRGNETGQEKPYSDLSDPKIRRLIPPGGARVLPEAVTKVVLSNRDVNRITCSEGPIKDIIYSKEKGITVKTEGNDAFVKFLITRDSMTGELKYATVPSEFYVVCGKDSVVYTLIALPRNVPAQAVQLVSLKKNIKKNISLFEGLPFERRVVLMVKAAFRNKIPGSFTVKRLNRPLNLFRYVNITLRREIRADGEGLLLKEYVLVLKDTYPGSQRRLEEKLFLLPELTQHPVGISLEKLILRKGVPSRLFIVERNTAEEGM